MKIKVKVYAPPFLDLSGMDAGGYITLKDGATVNTLYKALRIAGPMRPLVKCYVNHRPVKRSGKLRNGDTVSILGFLAGG